MWLSFCHFSLKRENNYSSFSWMLRVKTLLLFENHSIYMTRANYPLTTIYVKYYFSVYWCSEGFLDFSNMEIVYLDKLFLSRVHSICVGGVGRFEMQVYFISDKSSMQNIIKKSLQLSAGLCLQLKHSHLWLNCKHRNVMHLYLSGWQLCAFCCCISE